MRAGERDKEREREREGQRERERERETKRERERKRGCKVLAGCEGIWQQRGTGRRAKKRSEGHGPGGFRRGLARGQQHNRVMMA